MDSRIRPKVVLLAFISQTIANWLFVIWVKAQPVVNNAWFVVTPLIGFFYFAFTLIAVIWMHQRKAIGLGLAYTILTVGAAIDILSYSLVYQKNELIDLVATPLIIINFCVIAYMAFNQKYFKGN